jgi:hypothetical protein
LVRRKGLIVIAAAAAIYASCKPGATPPALPDQVPKIRATVVTIRTTLQPQNKTFTHTLVIAEGRARSGDEVDTWRLYDLRNKQVTFVDDLAKTYRNVPMATLIADRHAALARPLPDAAPRAEFVATGATRVLQAVPAAEHLIKLGGYERRLWIAKHPSLPSELFAMTQASLPASSPLAGVGREADEALMAVQGFPLVDHAELPFGNQKLVMDRSVVRIEQRDVPESWLVVGKGYTEIKEPVARPRSAS